MITGLRSRLSRAFSTTGSNAANAPTGTLSTPSPPQAKRLNRNALTVAAVIMGMTVIASLVVFNSESRETPRRTLATDPTSLESAGPTFLQRPVPRADESVPTATPSKSAGGSSVPRLSQHGAPSAEGGPTSGQLEPLNTGRRRMEVGSQKASEDQSAEARERAFNAALKRSAVASSSVRSPTEPDDGIAVRAATSPLAAQESELVAYGDSVMRSAAQGSPSKGNASAPRNAAANPRRAFLTDAGDLGGQSVLARLEPSGSPYALRAGTVIPAALMTAITSDLPGDCLGQITRDVYDSRTQRTLLIPKGSKLMCRYDDQVAAGQGRLLIAWTRLLLPDGRSMTLPGLALKDGSGQTGAKGDVDNHTGRVFGRALLLSMIGAGAQLSQPRQGSVFASPTAGQVAAGAVGQEMSNVALEVLRRGMDQPPTITVRQGETFNVFLNGDLVFDGPYSPTP